MYEHIPQELKDQPNWVCVRNDSKIPYRAGCDRAASSTDPETWTDFSTAVDAVASGRYDGIGYVFHDSGLVGIDIDCGFNSFGLLTRLASDIIGKCHSYTEVSRSGRGVHILLKGSLPFKGKNNQQGVEIYQTSRYFIMTGKVTRYREIIQNQEAIDYVVQKYFPESIRESTGVVAEKIYRPVYPRRPDGRIPTRPIYPPIPSGCRNLSLASLAGQLHNFGYDPETIYGELLYANRKACDPPLPEAEVEGIVNSITKYRR